MLALPGCAGLSRGGWNGPKYAGETTFDPSTMAALRAKKAVFFLREADLPRAAEFRDALTAAWSTTPLEVAAYADRARYPASGHVYFTLVSRNVVVHGGPNEEYFYPQIALVLCTSADNSRDDDVGYGRLPLALKFQRLFDDDGDMYQQSEFYDWTPPRLALYLRDLDLQLKQGRRRWFYDSFANEKALAELKTSCLYVPQDTLTQFSKTTSAEVDPWSERALWARYPHRHQVVTPEELAEAMKGGAQSVFVFDYVKSAGDKFISVFERARGIVYREYSAMSSNIDSDDIAALADAVG
ncbi:MAG TPA: hypothetical protein VHB79_29695 [Polyangiaceae bacterium]|nr:hypothetical protein [Polyangiaceae bacterium]